MGIKGVLMPIFSLPTEFGIGGLGKEAYNFIDFLAANGQNYWQVLPEGQTGYGDSPYQSFSAFAGNHYFIDLEILKEEGWLTDEELEEEKKKNKRGTIDYLYLFNTRYKLLKEAALRRKEEIMAVSYPNGGSLDCEFIKFAEEQKWWLDDYALFMAIKYENDNIPFRAWAEELRDRDPWAMEKAKGRLTEEIYCLKVLQFFFYKQHRKLKEYANTKRIKLIGDIPIYVSPDSVELWAYGEMFQQNENGELTVVAGCPPDGYSKNGQLWGNPIYDWEHLKNTNYDWWIRRLKHSFSMYDAVRIDHFRGFASYYAIPSGDEDAASGSWQEGPGKDFIASVKRALPLAEIIAEDLGFLTQDVKELLSFSGFPGMKVLQFAFESDKSNPYLPHNYQENSVVYTGTHDNPTIMEWIMGLSREQMEFAKRYLQSENIEKIKQISGEYQRYPQWAEKLRMALIEAAYESPSAMAIIPIQDLLGIGSEGRINTPGTLGGNWQWRLEKRASEY